MLWETLARRNGGRRPAVVWIQDRLDEKTLNAVEGCFEEEWVALTLLRFACLRAWTESVPDPRMKEDLRRRGPILMFLAPDGEVVSRLEGRGAISRSGVFRQVRKLWAATYEPSLRDYLGWMDALLARTDELRRRSAILARKRQAAGDDPQKVAALKSREEEVEALEGEIAGEEKAIEGRCRLRAPYRPDDPAEGAGGG